MSVRDRLRRLFPAAGLPYRLFDSSVLLFGVAGCWYVWSEPSAVTTTTVGSVYAALASPRGWGMALMAAATLGAACAYLSAWRWSALMFGYATLACVSGAWAAALVVGAALGDPTRDLAFKAAGSALLFAWITRILIAEVMTADDIRPRP